MKKNLICLLVFVLALTLTSCTKNDGETVKKVTDNNGIEYSAVVGSDGFLKLGERTGLVVRENGETKTVDFPNTLTVDDEIHTKSFKLKVPKGWENISDTLVKIEYTHDTGSAEMMINLRSSSTKDCRDEIENIMSSMKNEIENVHFDFAISTKLVYERNINFYIFSVNGQTYFIRTRCDDGLDKEINFEEIINTIQFRKGE